MFNQALIVDTLNVFYSILIEALPFVTLGVIVSSLLSIFVSDEALLAKIPKNKILGHIGVAFIGFFFPVCECGNVPVARRLLAKGVPVSQVVSFLLASAVNPIVIFATYTAFSFAPQVVILRMVLSFSIAVIVGLIVSLINKPDRFLTEVTIMECSHHEKLNTFRDEFRQIGRIFRYEITNTFGALIIGAAIAAFITTMSRNSVSAIASTPFLATVAMMILAFIMTICSTVDAFVALGYVGLFPLSSIISFMVFGPMINLRALSLILTTFKPKFVIMLTILVIELVLISSALLTVFGI